VINSSKRDLSWALDISCACKALEEGVFRFLRKDGTPFMTFGAGAIRGTLEPCQSEPICVMFSPGWYSSLKKLLTCYCLLFSHLQSEDFLERR